MWTRSFSFIISILAAASANHVAVLGPLVSKGGDTYKAYIATSEYSRKAELVLLLKCGEDELKQYFDLSQVDSLMQEVEFKLPKIRPGSCLFYSVVKQGNNCFKDEVYVENKLNNFLLLQTDKPVYKPNDIVKYQVVALDGDTKPIQFNEINVDISDGNGNLISSVKSVEGIRKKFGFFEGEIQISDEPNLGNWNIKVDIVDLNSTATKKFKVDHYTLPAFKIFIETQPRISFHEKNLNLNVYAKYSFDKFAKGKVNILTTVRSESNPMDVLSQNEKTEILSGEMNSIKINLKEDLSIHFLVKNVIIDIEIEFEEENTGIKSREFRQVLLVPKGKHIINLDMKEKFRPGFPYKIDAAVSTLIGTPEQSTSIPLTIKLKYDYESGQQGKNADITTVSFLRSGLAQFVLNPPADAKSIELTVDYDGSKIEEKVLRLEQSAEEFLQVVVLSENPQVGDTINITVKTNALLEPLNLVVFGKAGIVFSKSIMEAQNENSFNISLTLTPEMAPKADVIIFYLRDQDGNLIFDQFELNLGFQGKNFLSIKTPEETKKIREIVNIKASTLPNSLIALLAVDQSVTFMGTDNVISQSLVDLKLSPNSDVYPYEIEKKKKIFGNVNAFKLAPTAEKRKLCTMAEAQLFEIGYVGRLGSGFNVDPKLTQYAGQSNPRRNFPEVWFQEVQELSTASFDFIKLLPDTITSWVVGGFSINPQHGFAVAEQKKIQAFEDFFIRVEKPYSAKLTEIINIKVIIHNYMNTIAATTVTLNNKRTQFEFVDGNRNSLSFDKSLITQVRAGDTAQVTFKIRPKEAGKITLNIIAKTRNNAIDEIEESFLVEVPGITKHETRSVIMNLKNSTRFDGEFDFQLDNPIPNTITFEAITSTDLIGPALENLEDLIQIPEGCGEQKMRIISTTIMARKYLDETSQLSKEDKKRFNNILDRSYQDMMALQNRDGSFDLWGTSHRSDLWKQLKSWNRATDYLDLTAYIVKLLAQFETIKSIPNKSAINNAMKYIQRQQRRDGGFQNYGKPKFRDMQKFSNVDDVILTAYILISILENESLKNNYPTIVENGLRFLDNKYYDIAHDGTNYERAMTLYIYALTGKDHKLLLEKLNENAIQSHGKIYWNLNQQTQSSAAVQVEISSYMALAFIKLNQFHEAMKIVNFLVSMRNPKGGFESTTDTVLGLQTLSEASKVLYAKDTNINVQLMNQLNQESLIKVSRVAKRSVTRNLSPSTRKLTVLATGNGVASLQVSCQYKQKIKDFKEVFDLNVYARLTGENFLSLEVCVKTKRRENSNMAIMEIDLPSGFIHRHGPNDELKEIKKIELKNDGTKILIYIESISPQQICIRDIEAVQVARVDQLQKSSVTIYDYYEPDKIGMHFYNIQ